MRRWDGNVIHYDWHLDRVVAAIRSAAQDPEKPAIADALSAAIAKQQARDRVAARKRRQAETEAQRRQEEEAVITALWVELQALRGTDPGLTLLAVEYTTAEPARRVALYRRCAEEGDVQARGPSHGDPLLLKIALPSTLDLASLNVARRPRGFKSKNEP
jgi:hypothetical protein